MSCVKIVTWCTIGVCMVYYYCIKISHQHDYIKRGFSPWLMILPMQRHLPNLTIIPKKQLTIEKKYKRNNEGRYMCDYCDKDYSQTHNLRKHIANNHKTKVTAL